MKKLLIISLILFFLPQLGQAKHNYPRLANLHYYWSIEDDEVEDLAQWDILVVDIENSFYSAEQLRAIKEANPDILIFAYVSVLDLSAQAEDYDQGTFKQEIGEYVDQTDWILRNAKGEKVTWWQDYDILNVTSQAPEYQGQNWQDYLPRAASDRLKENSKIWDGVFYDNLWESISWLGQVDLDRDGVKDDPDEADAAWKKGVRKIIKRTQRYMGDDFKIIGNGGTIYSNETDGNFLEHFPDTIYGGWKDSMWNYDYIADQTRYPIINSNNKNKARSKVDYKDFRFGLTSTLLDKGYYSFDKGDLSHTEQWWFDEYSVALGEPLGDAYNLTDPGNSEIKKGVWRRDFANGLVLINSTDEKQKVSLESGYEKIKGEQDPDTNDGSLIGSLNIPSEDGIILLGKLAQIVDVPYVNGGYAKVFNSQGEMERNSFYSYDADYPGGTQVIELSDVNKTIVADDTYIYVYKNGKLKAKFAPYGESFTGGVNIAVDKLYKKDNRYYIVTGTQWYGPQIRIFNLKGNLKDPGCFPYAESFQGGVNVGVGDLNGDGRPEIISAAGYGGGPHIRILNNKCEVINPGFFAYDEHARFGVNIGVGDLDGDGKAEIVTGPGPGGSPQIRIFNRNGKLISGGFYAYEQNDTSGVLVGVTDVDSDGDQDIVTSSFGVYTY